MKNAFFLMMACLLVGAAGMVSCKKEQPGRVVQGVPEEVPVLEKQLLRFLSLMDQYRSGEAAAKGTSGDDPLISLDSARFYMETSLVYAHARLVNESVPSRFYHFKIDIPVTAGDEVKESDVAAAYYRIKDSLRAYLLEMEVPPGEKKQLEDVLLVIGEAMAGKRNIHVTGVFYGIGVLAGPYPGPVPNPESVHFGLFYPNISKLHWEESKFYDNSNQEHTSSLLPLKRFNNIFWHRQKIQAIKNGGIRYLYIKDGIPYGISMAMQDFIYGPPSVHYYGGFPVPAVPGLLNTAYFMAGSDDFLADYDHKLWVTVDMINFYLHKFAHLSAGFVPNYLINGIPWHLTIESIYNKTKPVIRYEGPNEELYLKYKEWHRWDLGVYYAAPTLVTLPPFTTP